ncbi:gamma-glutamylcyclotransferase family protein [Actinocorallia sp. B10E7]|uniref:gamma-glutamylcyclotransferase family protein n=1 Tax=Actinocorallia sp. B10E7 TaxID=3153558 RepID=UPI00325E6B65
MSYTESHPRREPRRGPKNRLSAAPDTLFVYGSLQFPEVLFALFERVPPHAPAQAPGWKVTALPNRAYPGLVPALAAAAGHLLTDLGPHEWQLLDAFEDPVYDLCRLDLTGGRHGWAYVCTPGTEILAEAWSADEFARFHLRDYVDRCTAWRQRYTSRRHV